MKTLVYVLEEVDGAKQSGVVGVFTSEAAAEAEKVLQEAKGKPCMDYYVTPHELKGAPADGTIEAAFEREWAKMFPVGDDGGFSSTVWQVARECFRRGALSTASTPSSCAPAAPKVQVAYVRPLSQDEAHQDLASLDRQAQALVERIGNAHSDDVADQLRDDLAALGRRRSEIERLA